MTLSTNFNVNPYYDDFNEDKKFLRMLFKPGYAVQARELTQSQTLLQNQVNSFGRHIFKNGSLVEGGQSFVFTAGYLKLDSAYSGTEVTANSFVGKTIVDNISTPSVRATVIKAFEADEGTGDPITLMVSYTLGTSFYTGNTIITYDASGTNAPSFANVSSTGNGQLYGISDGTYFYEGFFVKVPSQTIATAKYTPYSNVRVGFEIVETIVDSSSDTSLLDPAQNASNYQAPGADRYKIEFTLTSKDLNSEDTEKFIEISQIENGALRPEYMGPLYSVIQDEFARRTYDESGNYTVKTFKITLGTNTSNTAQTDVTVSPGKAYIYGYEFETVSPKIITVPKPREKESVSNKFLNANYGSYIYTKNHYGSLPIDCLATIDVHCVPNSSIDTTTTGKIANTKIGTIRVKTIEFDSASNTANSETYTYLSYLFDININNSIVGVANNATSNTVQLANTLLGTDSYSGVSQAYTGGKLRITSGLGAGEAPKLITNYDATSKTVTLSENWITIPNNSSQFSLDFEFNDAKSFAVFNSTTRVSSADIDDRSKDFASVYQDSYVSETSLEPLVFRLGQSYVSNNITDLTYSYRKLFQTSFGATDSGTLSVDSGEALSSATTTTEKLQDYQIIVTNSGTSPYPVGSTIPPASITSIDTVLKKISVTNADNMTANIIGTVVVSSTSAKTKSFITANPTVQTTGGESINTNGIIVYANSTSSQTTIQANNVIKIPGVPQLLYVSDVTKLLSVYDFNGGAIANTGYTDVTSRYELDDGQRDSFYDHASIKLKPGYLAPNGPLVVRYERYNSADAGGFFSVDSYPTYEVIPTFTSPVTGSEYSLRDCLDFRPVRKNATAAIGTAVIFNEGTPNNPKIARVGSDIILDYQYYLPRIDKLVLNKNKTFEVIRGPSSLPATEPANKDNAMVLYTLSNPPYVADTRDITVEYQDNRRYTMRDIGTLDKRIQNLEYYTTLTLLEQQTLQKNDLTILDSTNTPRFKNGIITDSFVDHSVADVFKEDYRAAVDNSNKELHTIFDLNAYTLDFDSANSSFYDLSGPLVTLDGPSVEFITQSLASRSININPFQVTNFLGKITLDPSSDIWVDTNRRPDLLVNVGGSQDAWDVLLTNTGASNFQYQWGTWQTNWTGNPTAGQVVDARAVGVNAQGLWEIQETIQTSRRAGQTRSGIGTRVLTENITQTIGDRVVDVSIVPFMRQLNVRFMGVDFKPDSNVYPFFDGVNVEEYCHRANEYVLANNNLKITESGTDECQLIDNTTSTANIVFRGVMTSNNILYGVSTRIDSTVTSNANLSIYSVGTNEYYNVIAYKHYAGSVQAATSNTVTLRSDALFANNTDTYVGSKIYITTDLNVTRQRLGQSIAMGQERTIVAYNASTRVATVDSNWTTIPVANEHTYGIGNLKTDSAGRVCGIFTIPNGTFRIGEKLFRLMDVTSGDLASSRTSGDSAFYASGLLQTKEETIISTVVPVVEREFVNQERVITLTDRSTRIVLQPPPFQNGDGGGGSDPTAETFFVSPAQYPDGIFVDKIRICFKTKDENIPVMCQLRPATNGYPSSSIVYPYGIKSLTPDQVNITNSPDLDDPTKYTEFVFDAPVYLQTGEHSVVFLTNSLNYEVYISEMGKLDIVTQKQISAQPYLGSFFASQNGSTWTADQNFDLMFRLYRRRFDNTTATAQFVFDPPFSTEGTNTYVSSNTKYDLIHFMVSDIQVSNTKIDYSFISEKETGGYTNQMPLVPLTDYTMDDGNGRRVFNPATGNNTFILRAALSSQNRDVSPVIDTNRIGFIAVTNEINELPLSNSGFVITNGGSGYTGNAKVVVSSPYSGGVTANAYAYVANGNVVSIIVDSPGSGYTLSPTVTIDPPPVAGGNTTATGIFNGEDKKSGGNAATRYIARRVTLADGFESGDLRVYITAYKPIGSKIYVYYKILSKSDTQSFDEREYQLMTEIGNANFSSLNKQDYRELTFAPGINGVANNSVSYTSDSTLYTTFKTFAIKIVISGDDPTDTPKIRDFRAIALPTGTV